MTELAEATIGQQDPEPRMYTEGTEINLNLPELVSTSHLNHLQSQNLSGPDISMRLSNIARTIYPEHKQLNMSIISIGSICKVILD